MNSCRSAHIEVTLELSKSERLSFRRKSLFIEGLVAKPRLSLSKFSIPPEPYLRLLVLAEEPGDATTQVG